MTVRTPGAESAICTGLTAGGGELDDELPQPANAAVAAMATLAAPTRPLT
jgi:hypothetical protein